MRIERLSMRRYRSLYDVTLEPRNLTVLVGPNNSGKSNIVDAIDFIAETYRYGLELAVGRKGGIRKHRTPKETANQEPHRIRRLWQTSR